MSVIHRVSWTNVPECDFDSFELENAIDMAIQDAVDGYFHRILSLNYEEQDVEACDNYPSHSIHRLCEELIESQTQDREEVFVVDLDDLEWAQLQFMLVHLGYPGEGENRLLYFIESRPAGEEVKCFFDTFKGSHPLPVPLALNSKILTLIESFGEAEGDCEDLQYQRIVR